MHSDDNIVRAQGNDPNLKKFIDYLENGALPDDEKGQDDWYWEDRGSRFYMGFFIIVTGGQYNGA